VAKQEAKEHPEETHNYYVKLVISMRIAKIEVTIRVNEYIGKNSQR
jgi:hypothetical protein